MFYHSLTLAFVCYALIGVAIAALGPVRKNLDEAVADLREAPASDDDSDSDPVSSTKILLFRAVMSLAVVLLWWRFLVFVLKSRSKRKIVRMRGEVEPRIAETAEH